MSISRRSRWSPAEIEIIANRVSEGDDQIKEIARELMSALPGRSYHSIRSKIAEMKAGVSSDPDALASYMQAQKDAGERLRDRQAIQAEALIRTVAKALTPLKFAAPPMKARKYKRDQTKESAVLLLSDIHFGKTTSTYNSEMAIASVCDVLERTVRIIDLHRGAFPIEELHIMMLGDIVDGELIYPTHPHHIDSGVIDQIFSPLPVLVQKIAELTTRGLKVHLHGVPGNHGRISKHMDELSNFDFMFYKVLEVALSGVKGVTFDFPRGWRNVVTVQKTRFLMFHGDQIKMTLNLPWYGVTTRVSRWAVAQTVDGFDVAVHGHFHVLSHVEWGGKTILANGTLVDRDEFALEKLGLESTRAQWLFGVHPERGITWQYALRPGE